MTLLALSNNRLFALARQARRLPPWLAAIVLTVVFVLVAPLVGIPIFLLTSYLPSDDSPIASALQQTLQLIATFAPIAGALWLWVHLYEQRPFSTLGLERPGALRNYVRGLLLGVAMFSVVVALVALPGYIEPEAGNPRFQGIAALSGVMLVVLGWLIQGGVEEVLTRGWLMSVVGARYRPWLGVLVSSLVFAFLHSLNPNLSILAVVNLSLFGLFAALYALSEGGLWGICGLHAAWNWAQGNLFGLEVSGQAIQGGMLFNLQERGPDVLTGGPFGPEAGLAVTVVLVVGIGILVMRQR